MGTEELQLLLGVAGSVAPFFGWFGVDRARRRRSRLAFDGHFSAMGERMGFRLLTALGAPSSHARKTEDVLVSKWAVASGEPQHIALPGAGMFRTPASTSLAFAGTREGLLLQALTNPAHIAVTCYFGERLRLTNAINHLASGVFLLSPKRDAAAKLVTGDGAFDARFLVSVAGLIGPLRGKLSLPAEFRNAALDLAAEEEITLMYDGVSAVVTVPRNPDDETFRRILRLLEAFESFVPALVYWRWVNIEIPPG